MACPVHSSSLSVNILCGKYPLRDTGCIREGSFLKTQIRNPQDIHDVSSERASSSALIGLEGARLAQKAAAWCESATACTAHPPSPDTRPDEQTFDWLGRHWLFGLVA